MDSRGSNETMSFFVDVVTEDSFYENLTLGVVKILENSPCVKNVRVNRRNGCERNAIANWEQRHGCMLPEDVKNFYASIDGFLLQWNLEIAGTSSLYIFFFLFPFLFFFLPSSPFPFLFSLFFSLPYEISRCKILSSFKTEHSHLLYS